MYICNFSQPFSALHPFLFKLVMATSRPIHWRERKAVIYALFLRVARKYTAGKYSDTLDLWADQLRCRHSKGDGIIRKDKNLFKYLFDFCKPLSIKSISNQTAEFFTAHRGLE